eukprot:1158604-Pelagomonas_calceolata.AAC.8
MSLHDPFHSGSENLQEEGKQKLLQLTHTAERLDPGFGRIMTLGEAEAAAAQSRPLPVATSCPHTTGGCIFQEKGLNRASHCLPFP